METVIKIIVPIIVIVLGFLSYYLKTKTNIISKIAELIAQAEEKYKLFSKSGDKKKEYVVDLLYGYIPAILKPLFTKECIGMLVENIFVQIKSFLNTNLEKSTDIIEDKLDEVLDK